MVMAQRDCVKIVRDLLAAAHDKESKDASLSKTSKIVLLMHSLAGSTGRVT